MLKNIVCHTLTFKINFKIRQTKWYDLKNDQVKW